MRDRKVQAMAAVALGLVAVGFSLPLGSLGAAPAAKSPAPKTKVDPSKTLSFMKNDFFVVTVDLPPGATVDPTFPSSTPTCEYVYTTKTGGMGSMNWDFVKARKHKRGKQRLTLVFLARKPADEADVRGHPLDGLGAGDVNTTVPITNSGGMPDTSASKYPVEEVTES